MVVPLCWIYVVVELAAVVGLASTIGIGWMLLILLATFVVGLSVAGSQIKRQLRRLRNGMTGPHATVSDSALLALGALLVVIPGLVTSVLGLLLLLPPTRVAARPVLRFLAVRGIGRRASLITVAGRGASRAGHGEVIDGEVIDGEVIDGEVIDGEVVDVTVPRPQPPALPHQPE